MVLADKGYHTGAELNACQQDNMITHVAYKEQPSVKHIASEFLAESFFYNKRTNNYKNPLKNDIIKKKSHIKPFTALKHTAQMPVKHVP